MTEENLIESNSNVISSEKTQMNTAIGKGFFSIFFNIPIPVFNIRNATPALIPTKAYFTIFKH